jgi:ferredoxin-NADP reductase
MATSLRELINWMGDVQQYLRVSRRRKSMRQSGRGYDYTKDRSTVKRVVSRLHPQRMQLRATQVIQATPTTKTFTFERIDGPIPAYRPGQYINVFVDVDGVQTSRPYSIASAPSSNHLELTVRNKSSGFVAPFLLHEIQVGDELETTGPAGQFYHEPLIDGDNLVFLAGGSGITPFMSIIREYLEGEQEKAGIHIQLLYGSRIPDDVIYNQELTDLATKHPNFRYSLVISEPPPGYKGLSGLLDLDLIRQQVGEFRGKTFYICGPNIMHDFCLAALTQLGVPPRRIKRELYGPPEDITKEAGWPEEVTTRDIFTVEIIGQKTVRAPANEPLMNTLERHGIILPAICRVGECSYCRIKLISGEVYMPANTGIRQSDKQLGYIHACVSYPLKDIKIRI